MSEPATPCCFRRKLRGVIALSALLLIAGCSAFKPKGSVAEQVEGARYLAAYTESEVPKLSSHKGVYEAGDYDSNFIAYFNGNDLVLINESFAQGDYGAGTARYYFRDHKLYYYSEASSVRNLAQPGTPLQQVNMDLFFNPDGSLLEAEKQIDSRSVEPSESEVAAVVKHAEQLHNSSIGVLDIKKMKKH